MNISQTYHLWISAFYGTYFTLTTFAINPFVFLTNQNAWISYPSIFVVSCLMSWGLLKLSSKFSPSVLVHSTLILGTFITSLTCGTTALLLNASATTDLLLYYSTFLILPILPISIYVLWFLYFDLNKQVILSTEKNESEDQSLQKLFRITNIRDQVILERPIERIIAFEANDNYVNTYYLNDDDSVDKTIHRISLKKVTELLIQIDTEFYRVHKSYLINPEFIWKVKGKSQAYRLELFHLSIEVPVSRSFDIKMIQPQEN